MVKGMRKIGAVLLTLCMIAALAAMPAQALMAVSIEYSVFLDLPKVAWYSNYMEKALQEDFFFGISKTLFDPDRAITRGEAVTVLSRLYVNLMNEPLPNYGGVSTFADVPSDRFYSAPIVWAEREGIASGVTEDNFGPENPVTQQELAVMFDRFLSVVQPSRLPALSESEVDLTGVADWAKDAVQNISGYEVFTSAHWDPDAPALRGECSAFFVRLYEHIVYHSPMKVRRQEFRYVFPEGSVAEDFYVVLDGTQVEGEDRIGRIRLIESYSEYREVLSRAESFCQSVPAEEELEVTEASFSDGRKLIAIEIKATGMPEFNAELSYLHFLPEGGGFIFNCDGYTKSAKKDITGQIFFLEIPDTITDLKMVDCSVMRWTEDVVIEPEQQPQPSPSPSVDGADGEGTTGTETNGEGTSGTETNGEGTTGTETNEEGTTAGDTGTEGAGTTGQTDETNAGNTGGAAVNG